jgi:hypothetical protein
LLFVVFYFGLVPGAVTGEVMAGEKDRQRHMQGDSNDQWYLGGGSVVWVLLLVGSVLTTNKAVNGKMKMQYLF